MSSQAPSPAPGQLPGLWERLVDDAAVFPPGLAPWGRAVHAHLRHRRSAYGPAVGPLLVPAAGVEEFLATPGSAHPGPEIALVSPAGAGPAFEALGRLAGAGVVVTAVELPLPKGAAGTAAVWQRLAGPDDAKVWWEVDRGQDLVAQVEAVAEARETDQREGGVKLRMGGTSAADIPPPALVAEFLHAAVRAGSPVKLTAGLHHAVRGPDTVSAGVTHGVLNVVLAVAAAVQGASADVLAHVLARTDGDRLAAETAALDATDVTDVRRCWASFGCCGVTDPLTELAALGLFSKHDLPTHVHLQEVP